MYAEWTHNLWKRRWSRLPVQREFDTHCSKHSLAVFTINELMLVPLYSTSVSIRQFAHVPGWFRCNAVVAYSLLLARDSVLWPNYALAIRFISCIDISFCRTVYWWMDIDEFLFKSSYGLFSPPQLSHSRSSRPFVLRKSLSFCRKIEDDNRDWCI